MSISIRVYVSRVVYTDLNRDKTKATRNEIWEYKQTSKEERKRIQKRDDSAV